MYKVIYTATLDHAVDIVAKSWEYTDASVAVERYKEQVRSIVDKAIDNEFLKINMSTCTNHALIKIEGTVHCVALIKE